MVTEMIIVDRDKTIATLLHKISNGEMNGPD
jgi:hypothetical protein